LVLIGDYFNLVREGITANWREILYFLGGPEGNLIPPTKDTTKRKGNQETKGKELPGEKRKETTNLNGKEFQEKTEGKHEL